MSALKKVIPRLVIDRHFFAQLFTKKEEALEIIKKLSAIHRNFSSEDSSCWNQNTILDSCFKEVIKEKDIRKLGVLLGSVHPVNFWNAEGVHSSVLKHAIDVADKPPYAVAILTDERNFAIYNKSKHYAEYPALKQAIVLYEGQSAKELIKDLFLHSNGNNDK